MSLIDSRPTKLLNRFTQAIADRIDAAISSITGGGSPPTSLKNRITSNADLDGNIENQATTTAIGVIAASTSSFDVWTNLINETASGVISYIMVYQNNNTSSRDTQLRCTIDGTQVYISDADLWKLTGEDGAGLMLFGGVNEAGMETVVFKTSLKVDFKKTENAAGTVALQTRAWYYLT